jgi:hypothetical protein
MKPIRKNSQLDYIISNSDNNLEFVHYKFKKEMFWVENKSLINPCFKRIKQKKFNSLVETGFVMFKEIRYFSKIYKLNKDMVFN